MRWVSRVVLPTDSPENILENLTEVNDNRIGVRCAQSIITPRDVRRAAEREMKASGAAGKVCV